MGIIHHTNNVMKKKNGTVANDLEKQIHTLREILS